MRIVGYILLVFGILLEVLLVAGEIADKTFNYPMLTYGMPFIGLGVYLSVRYGRVPGHTQKAPASVAAASVRPVVESQSPTLELPVTPAISELVSRQMQRTRRLLRIVALSAAAFLCLVGAGMGYAVGPDGKEIFLVFLGLGLVVALMIWAIGVLFGTVRMRRDLQEFTYLRTSGPFELYSVKGGYLLKLVDRSFHVDLAPAKAMRNLPWATIDHTRNAHLVLAVWDQAGNVVYRLGGNRS